MADPLVSIILRSFNEGWALRETLPGLQAQEYRNWELIVIDSGSTDDSVELILKVQPTCFIQIRHEEYIPGRVLNLGMELARAEFGIFLNADATPLGRDWLRPLVVALQAPDTAAVFGRQIPRGDCRAVFAHDYERCFGARRESAQWEHFFSMANSGLRKDIWARRGFLEKFQYSEDDEYSRWCRAQGHRVVYVPESVVIHSHNYTPQQAYKRSYGEAKALAAVWSNGPRAINWPRTVLLGWLNDARRDLGFCARTLRLAEWPHAARIRWQQRRAKLAGFRDGWKVYRNGVRADDSRIAGRASGPLVSGDDRLEARPTLRCDHTVAPGSHPHARFTIDGSDVLEERLAILCERVGDGVRSIISPHQLDALVLGGGYGRGEGGVLKTESGERPYNDLEFYVFVRRNRLWSERRYRSPLQELSDRLSADAGLHVEFKVDSLARLRRSPVTMFSYDLVSGHRAFWSGSGEHRTSNIEHPTSNDGTPERPVIGGSRMKDRRAAAESVLRSCEPHLDARGISLCEATRLLLNRCTGLLLAKEFLRNDELTADQSDFVGRNLAKAELALGDAVLTAYGHYHWSCVERRERLIQLGPPDVAADELPWLAEVRQRHAAAADFKLHPQRISKSLDAFAREHDAISSLALRVWLWLEGRRLNRQFSSARDYAFSPIRKCFGTPMWRNLLLNAKIFGARGLRDGLAMRYPRERLLNSLPLLLWDEPEMDVNALRHLQTQLRTATSDWLGLVAAYKRLWMEFR